jgi:nucleotide-binding universal stress UspA family protein
MSFKNILFPTDFSPNANHALKHAIRIANFSKGEVIVQHVVSDYFERHSHWATLFDIHELQKFMDIYVDVQMSKALPKDATNITIRPVISKGKPAEEIAAMADKELVDLVVMGSAKGVTTGKVVRLTNRPVLAISATTPVQDVRPEHGIERMLVATDFSEHSKKVVRYAFDLKRMFGAMLYMLYVIEMPKAIDFGVRQGHFTDTLARMREWATNQLASLTPIEFITDPTVVRFVEVGSASDSIAEIAEEIGADLTILGTHEYGVIHKHLLGTTTDKLLTKTSVPVLALKL